MSEWNEQNNSSLTQLSESIPSSLPLYSILSPPGGWSWAREGCVAPPSVCVGFTCGPTLATNARASTPCVCRALHASASVVACAWPAPSANCSRQPLNISHHTQIERHFARIRGNVPSFSMDALKGEPLARETASKTDVTNCPRQPLNIVCETMLDSMGMSIRFPRTQNQHTYRRRGPTQPEKRREETFATVPVCEQPVCCWSVLPL